MKQCPYCGKEYEDSLEVCPTDGQTLVGPAVPTGPRATLQMQIKFHTAEGLDLRKLNLAFQGRGLLEVATDSLVFSGKQRASFSLGRKATVEIRLGEVFNVARSGRQITLVIRSSDVARNSTFCFSTDTEHEAVELETLLPKAQTPDFVQAQIEQQDFNARLFAATPKVFVTPTLIWTNVAVFAAMTAAGAGLLALPGEESLKYFQINPEVHMKWGANFGPLTTNGQWWRLLTSTFLHFGILHLLFNMWALYVTGQLVERLYGNGFFLLLYLAAGVSGSVASVLWNPEVLSAGASGAIFGIYGALLAYLLLQRDSVAPSIVKAQRNSVLGFLAYNLVFGLSHGGIDNAAHLGGLAGGALVGLALARPLDATLRSQRTLSRAVAGACMAVIVPVLASLPVKNSGKTYQQEEHFRTEVKWFIDEEKSILAAWEDARVKSKSGKQTDSEMAQSLASGVARWQTAYDRLAGVQLDENAPLSKERKSLLTYIELRRDAMKALQEAINGNNLSKIEEFRSLQAKADKVVDEMTKEKKNRGR